MQTAAQPSQSFADFLRAQRDEESREVGRLTGRIKQLERSIAELAAENQKLRALLPAHE